MIWFYVAGEIDFSLFFTWPVVLQTDEIPTWKKRWKQSFTSASNEMRTTRNLWPTKFKTFVRKNFFPLYYLRPIRAYECVWVRLVSNTHNSITTELSVRFFIDAVSVEVTRTWKQGTNVNLLSLMAAKIYRKELITLLPCQSTLN